ncbi:hypothetical protein [Seleniivibrio woodruffii]|uniref:flagellin N-terminal helical domain-containing protein n=1 Tax=Seleniivibrio woodruffii TaxID=1078050 RepID=UPI00164484AB|nr:hypothetical protein [Seleniivibrio woodruffii]
MNQTSRTFQKTFEKLSSGLRINSAADDASGLAILRKLRGRCLSLKRASSNAQDVLSSVPSAKGGLATIPAMTQRMERLAVIQATGVYNFQRRAGSQKEVDQLKDRDGPFASSTEFNTKKLLNGNALHGVSTTKESPIDVAGQSGRGQL